MTDIEVCYKAFRREVLESIRLEEERFGFEPESTAKVSRGSWRIYEVPVSYYGRTDEEGKKIGWRDGVRALYCILEYNLGARRWRGTGFGREMEVSFYATIRAMVGAKTLEVDLPEGSSVRELLDRLVERCPPLGEKLLDPEGRLSRSVQVFVDGRGALYLPDGLETKLRADQSVDIFPAVAGG